MPSHLAAYASPKWRRLILPSRRLWLEDIHLKIINAFHQELPRGKGYEQELDSQTHNFD